MTRFAFTFVPVPSRDRSNPIPLRKVYVTSGCTASAHSLFEALYPLKRFTVLTITVQ